MKGIVGRGMFVDFSPKAFKDLAAELSFLGEIRIEFLRFEKTISEMILTFHSVDIPQTSKESDERFSNHIIFWINENKILEFWKYMGKKLGIIYDTNFSEGDFDKTEFYLHERGWFTKRTKGFVGRLSEILYPIIIILVISLFLIDCVRGNSIGILFDLLLALIIYLEYRGMRKMWNLY